MKVFSVSRGVKLYQFGKPYETNAVIIKPELIINEELKYLKKIDDDVFFYKMESDDIVYGLGQSNRGINKRGWIYESFCTDEPVHTPDKKALYGAHNFFIVHGKESFGIFIDSPGKIVFDIGYTNINEILIKPEYPDINLYIIEGKSLYEISKRFRCIIGKPYVPPKWAFGFIQSRWGYKTYEDIRNVAESLDKHDIPCDAICLDIDYMDKYKIFTVNEKSFPDFKNIVDNLKKKGFRLIPIIDPGIKIEKGYKVYENGLKNNYFCVDSNGKEFTAAVWPGLCHFPDFFNPDVRKWFGELYHEFLEAGIDGFWNDMNEPVIFYTQERLESVIEYANKNKTKNMDMSELFLLMDKFTGLMNNHDDYKKIFHKSEKKFLSHYKVHNLYSHNMNRSTSVGLRTFNSNKRFLLFSRASYIGSHRYAGIWTGDNHSWWEHIRLNMSMMPGLNMCGFLYCGADTGGFSCNATADLIIRWTQFSIFTPLFRNHSAMNSRVQEPFAFDIETTKTMRNLIRFRYGIIPYIYSEYMKAVKDNDLFFTPLSFKYSDNISKTNTDQLLTGDSLMIAPVMQQNAFGRYVWLPEEMLLWKTDTLNKKDIKVLEKGHHYIETDLNEFLMFIRPNKIFIFGDPAGNVDSLNCDTLYIIAFVKDKAEYCYYTDDGESYDYEKGVYHKMHISIINKDDDYLINIEGSKDPDLKKLICSIYDKNGKCVEKTVCL